MVWYSHLFQNFPQFVVIHTVTYHARTDMIKDRNGKDLTEPKEIKKRWQEYTEKLYKKCLNDPDNRDGMVTHLEPNILEREVTWA